MVVEIILPGNRALCKKVLTYSYVTIATLIALFLLFPQVIAGIALIRKIMSDFQYMRVLNMNNTIIRLKIGERR